MNLVIRTQNKEALIPYNGLYINEYYDYYMISSYPIDYPNKLISEPVDCVPFGFYKTRERALEVLDEIQNIFDDKSTLNINSQSIELTSNPRVNVYVMPEK